MTAQLPPARRTATGWQVGALTIPAGHVNGQYRNSRRWDAKPSTGNSR